MISGIERRVSERATVMLSVDVEHCPRPGKARLTNLSSTGALVAGPTLHPRTRVLIRRHGMEVPSYVVWSSRGVAGVRFDKPVDTAAMLRFIPQPRPRHAVRNRRPGLKCVPLSHADQTFLAGWGTAGKFVLGD